MKNFKKSLFSSVFLLIFSSSLLTGCALLPIQTSSGYFKDIYKRIRYTIEGRYRVIDIFYATSRKPYNRSDRSIYFTNDIAGGVTTGHLDIKIDPKLKIEKMLPYRLKRRGIIGIQDIDKIDEDAFIKELS
ncbi:MAG: hypothetical protein WC482_02585, partial [Candidatus Omnitrophota bacterium]